MLMKNVTEIKSLGDMRTATSHHITAKPPLKGTTYLDLYLLDKEKQRLEKELFQLAQRQRRINERLTEIAKSMDKLAEAAQEEQKIERPSATTATGKQAATIQQDKGRQWKTMALQY